MSTSAGGIWAKWGRQLIGNVSETARSAGIPRDTLSRWVNGTQGEPQVTDCYALARALGEHPAYVAFGVRPSQLDEYLAALPQEEQHAVRLLAERLAVAHGFKPSTPEGSPTLPAGADTPPRRRRAATGRAKASPEPPATPSLPAISQPLPAAPAQPDQAEDTSAELDELPGPQDLRRVPGHELLEVSLSDLAPGVLSIEDLNTRPMLRLAAGRQTVPDLDSDGSLLAAPVFGKLRLGRVIGNSMASTLTAGTIVGLAPVGETDRGIELVNLEESPEHRLMSAAEFRRLIGLPRKRLSVVCLLSVDGVDDGAYTLKRISVQERGRKWRCMIDADNRSAGWNGGQPLVVEKSDRVHLVGRVEKVLAARTA